MTGDTESKPTDSKHSNGKEQVNDSQESGKVESEPTTSQLPLHLMAGLVGLVGYILAASLSGVAVAWASPWYYVLGWPFFCLATAWLSRRCPERSWRWPLSMMLGQVFASILYGNTLFPVAMLFVTLLSLPQFLVASYMSRQAAQ